MITEPGGPPRAKDTSHLACLRLGLERLAPEDLLWEGEVICAAASR